MCLENLVAFEPFKNPGRHFIFPPSLVNNLDAASRGPFTLAPLSDLRRDYLKEECFRGPANFRMLGHGRGQRATLSADQKLFFLLLNACGVEGAR